MRPQMMEINHRISPDSVQLLVSVYQPAELQQQQQHHSGKEANGGQNGCEELQSQQEQEATRSQRSREASSKGATATATAASNSLLMMQEPYSQQQVERDRSTSVGGEKWSSLGGNRLHERGNNEQVEINNTNSWAPTNNFDSLDRQCSIASSGAAATTTTVTTTEMNERHHDEETTWQLVDKQADNGSHFSSQPADKVRVSASKQLRMVERQQVGVCKEDSSKVSSSSSLEAKLSSSSSRDETELVVRSSEGAESSLLTATEVNSAQKQQQRQRELLQLMRLRQHQLNGANSNELPTLQELQQQMQQLKLIGRESSSAQVVRAGAVVQSQAQQRNRHCVSAAASSVAQQRLGQQQRRPDNATGSTNSKALDMEMEQATAAQRRAAAPVTVNAGSMAQQQQQLRRGGDNKLISDISGQRIPLITTYLTDDNQPHSLLTTTDGNHLSRQADLVQSASELQQQQQRNNMLANQNTTTRQQQSSSLSSSRREPIPTPRLYPNSRTSSIQDELSILTNSLTLNPRVKDLSQTSGDIIMNSDSSSSPAQSSAPNSILSDSTTLITEAAMNSSELIPKLIERLDRKLIVMKEEQLTLMREIELNEATGQRLFESMRRHLTLNEFEKISLHAIEIEKVTKLILSLRLRLKKVEVELKDRSQANERSFRQQQRLQNQSITSHSNNDLSQRSLKCYEAESIDPSSLRNIQSATTVRGVSDPTSTVGLPKRNFQHHASLQSSAPDQNNSHIAVGRLIGVAKLDPNSMANKINGARTESSSENGCNESVNSSRVSDINNQSGEVNVDQDSGAKATSSNSSDSIFNSADSAIGSTITGHGGSATNIEQPAISQSSLSSTMSQGSSLASSTRDKQHHSQSPSESHLSSNISVSSHSSISSVPNSSPLMSPASASCLGTLSPSSVSISNNGKVSHFKDSSVADSNASLNISGLQQNIFSHSDKNNNSSRQGPNESHSSDVFANDSNDSMTPLLSDTDILMAKRNKLLSQLEEAHQLEECIVHRNTIIIQRILKKYYNETGQDGEIAEFKQFTRLKSLLLKDSHDISDRIDNAELQLTELKQSNLCEV